MTGVEQQEKNDKPNFFAKMRANWWNRQTIQTCPGTTRPRNNKARGSASSSNGSKCSTAMTHSSKAQARIPIQGKSPYTQQWRRSFRDSIARERATTYQTSRAATRCTSTYRCSRASWRMISPWRSPVSRWTHSIPTTSCDRPGAFTPGCRQNGWVRSGRVLTLSSPGPRRLAIRLRYRIERARAEPAARQRGAGPA